MPRLVNAITGVIVNVDEATAKGLGREWSAPKAAEKPRSETPDATWKVAELAEYATENGIDLGGATKKDDVLAAILSAANPQ